MQQLCPRQPFRKHHGFLWSKDLSRTGTALTAAALLTRTLQSSPRSVLKMFWRMVLITVCDYTNCVWSEKKQLLKNTSYQQSTLFSAQCHSGKTQPFALHSAAEAHWKRVQLTCWSSLSGKSQVSVNTKQTPRPGAPRSILHSPDIDSFTTEPFLSFCSAYPKASKMHVLYMPTILCLRL